MKHDVCGHVRPTSDDMGAAWITETRETLIAEKPPAMACQLNKAHQGTHQADVYTESGPFAMNSTYYWE